MKKIILLVFACFAFIISNAQNENEIDKLKKSTLYVVIDEEAHDKNPEYAKVYQDFWELSKVEIISPNEFLNNVKANAYYATITVSMDKGENTEKHADRIFYFISIWSFNPDKIEKYINKMKKGDDIDMREYKDFSTGFVFWMNKNMKFTINDVIGGEYFGGKYNIFGGVGVFKNKLQQLQIGIINNSKSIFRKELTGFNSINVVNKTQLTDLKKNILYIPKQSLLDADKGTYISVKSVFADYPWKYELIDMVALNDKILNSTENFYYLKKDDNIHLQIINGYTGEDVYLEMVKGFSFNVFSSKKLERLIKNIEKEAN